MTLRLGKSTTRFPNVQTFRDPWGFYAAWKTGPLAWHIHFGNRFGWKRIATLHWRPNS